MALVEVAQDGDIAVVTLNRPEARNALSVELCEDLVVALHGLQIDRNLRVAIIRGAGRTFCAGADVQAVSGPDALDFVPAFEAMLEAVARFPLPTIAEIHGGALGGGFQLATVCDFRIATTDAQIAIPSARLGILVNFENIQRLVLLAGIARAKELLMSGRVYSGAEAATAGLVTRAVTPEQLPSETRAFADEVARLAPLSVQGAKRALQFVADHLASARTAHPDAAAEIDRLVTEVYGSEDLGEGLRALSEKRAPNFKGG